MARSIYNVDFVSFIRHADVFGEDGDSPFPFKVVVVQDQLPRILLAFPRHLGLGNHLVHKRGLSVVHVGHNGYIPNILHNGAKIAKKDYLCSASSILIQWRE